MGDAFRRLFLSIGVALGLATGQVDPVIVARVESAATAGSVGERGPERGALTVSARIDHAFAPSAIELVETGTRVALRYSARLEGASGSYRAVSETRSIWYDMRTGRYRVSFDGGKEAALVDPQAARGLAAELSGLALGSGAGSVNIQTGAQVIVSAEIGIIDGRGEWHDAPVLWNYSAPRTSLTIGGR